MPASGNARPDQVVAEMRALYDRFGVTYFYFCDELAIVSRKQIFQLTEAILQKPSADQVRMDCASLYLMMKLPLRLSRQAPFS